MESIIMLVLIVGTTAVAHLLHSYQKRRESKRHIGKALFTVTFIASLFVFAANFLIDKPFDYYIGASGIFMFFLSINGYGVIKIIEMFELRQQKNN